jgi:hypothetical protein
MDQPYSRIADALLDYQYWSPNDPQRNPYDDTGWTFPEGFGVQAVRITDPKVLSVKLDLVKGDVKAVSGTVGAQTASTFVINHNADNALITLRYRLKDAEMQMAEEPFEAAGQKFNRGSFIVRGVAQPELDRVTSELGLRAYGVDAAPSVKTHPARAARVALLHTWSTTQTEGWWRQAFDVYGIPYDYIDPETIYKTPNLRAKYDVIVFGPGGGPNLIDGTPMFRNPQPWKNSPETPNIGTWAQTDDTRPGLQLEGLLNIRNFINEGGAFVAATNSAEFLLTSNVVRGVTAQRPGADSRVVGSLLRTRVADELSPIMYGIQDNLAVYSNSGNSFSGVGGGGGGRAGGGGAGAPAGTGRGGGPGPTRATGRGTPDDPDIIQGRPATMGTEDLGPPLPGAAGGGRGGGGVTVPAELRPRTLRRFDEQNRLLVSGLLAGGADIAGQAVVVDVPMGKGHAVLFANNPIWRGETIGSYFMVFNAMLNFDSLGAGRITNNPAPTTGGRGGGQ